MKEGYYVIRTYKAGSVEEKTKFFVPGSRPTGKTRRLRNAAKKAEQNEYATVKALARILNANYHGGDLFIGLDYSEEGMEKILRWGRKNGMPVDSEDEQEKLDAVWECAAHEMDNCIRRVKRILQKGGMELKACYITSDMDGATGESVRVHHHLVIQPEARDAFIAAWQEKGLGGVSYSPMWDYQDDRTQLAEYMIRQVRRIPDAKKYRSTRNLVRPEPKDRIVDSAAELRVPAGAKLLFRAQYNRPGDVQYIRYLRAEKPKKRE